MDVIHEMITTISSKLVVGEDGEVMDAAMRLKSAMSGDNYSRVACLSMKSAIIGGAVALAHGFKSADPTIPYPGNQTSMS